ncbi:hypothetical protein [Gracilimonas tropica]|uniref:hypothetical protein n=1 Tax=Gracilimonas tropica TaxID=454600 RepID=UPI000377B66D|nr:hypothetical protein [Gracilimonas tropica]
MMKLNILIVVIVGYLIISVIPLKAQIKTVQRGETVRITAPSVLNTYLIGEVLAISDKEIRIKDITHSPPWHDIPFTSISKMEVKRLESQTTEGALIGAALTGITFGLIAMGMGDSKSCNEGDWMCYDIANSGELFLGGAVFGGLAGALIGGTIGSGIDKEKWQRVKLKFDTMQEMANNNRTMTVAPGIRFTWQI